MAITLSFVGVTGSNLADNTQREVIADFTLTFSGNYGGAATNGDTINFSGFDQVKSGQIPMNVEVYEAPAAGTAPTGYFFNFCPGTTPANGVLWVGQCAAAGNPISQITQGSAYPAALTAATWMKCRAYFAKNI